MLYDPKWDRNSLFGLRDWLAQQPASTTYDWTSCQDCVVGRYLGAHSELATLAAHRYAYSKWCTETPGAALAVPECFSDYAVGGGRQEMTYGQALANLDSWLAANASAFAGVPA